MEHQDIQKILADYAKRKEYYKSRYHNKVKNDPIQIEKARERARLHYKKNKEKRADYYEKNKDIMKLMNKYRYYKKNSSMERFISKYPNEYQLLLTEERVEPPPQHQEQLLHQLLLAQDQAQVQEDLYIQ